MPDNDVPDIRELRPDHTRCRTIGHAWYEVDSDWAKSEGAASFGTPVTLRCDRCTTERRETWDRHTGDLATRYYVYPDGYQQRWGGNFPTRADFRLALLAIKLNEKREDRKAGRNGMRAV
jgi:hypothetical protein